MYSLFYRHLLTLCISVLSLSAFSQSESLVYSTSNPLSGREAPDLEAYYKYSGEGIYFSLNDYLAGKPSMTGQYLHANKHSVTFLVGDEQIQCPAKRVWGFRTNQHKTNGQPGTFALIKGEFWQVEQEGAIWVFSQEVNVPGLARTTCFLMTKKPEAGKYAFINPHTVAAIIDDQPLLYAEYQKLSYRKKCTRARWFLEKYNSLNTQLISSPQVVQRTTSN